MSYNLVDPTTGDLTRVAGNAANADLKDLNVYSTEEKIVGTWIDGKPIYKLTIKGYSGSGGVSLSDYNIKYPLKIEGFAKNYGDSSSSTPLPTFGSNGETASLVFYPSEVIYVKHGFVSNHSDIDFTIWYTKTTD